MYENSMVMNLQQVSEPGESVRTAPPRPAPKQIEIANFEHPEPSISMFNNKMEQIPEISKMSIEEMSKLLSRQPANQPA
jgi:hypothetical protein